MNTNSINNLLCNKLSISVNYDNLANILYNLDDNKLIKGIIENNLINNIKIQYNGNEKKEITDNLENLYKYFIVQDKLILINNLDSFKNELDNILKNNSIKDVKI